MPKGYIRSVTIKKPKVGMQIIPYELDSHFQFITKIVDENNVIVNDRKNGFGFQIPRKISELKELVIEYQDYADKITGNQAGQGCIITGHVRLKDSEWARAIINEEVDSNKQVEFEIKTFTCCPHPDEDSDSCAHMTNMAGCNECEEIVFANIIPHKKSSLPDHYAGELNFKRIEAWQKLAKEYNIEEGTVREIFCKGADWYKKVIENNL